MVLVKRASFHHIVVLHEATNRERTPVEKQQPIISARVRLTRLLEEVPDEWMQVLVPLIVVVVARLRRFQQRPVTPVAAFRFERGLARTLWEFGRRLVELAYNGIEPKDGKLLPTRLRIGLDEYRRNRRTPRNLFCLFGPICLWRVVYQAVQPGMPGLFPLEQALGVVRHLATPALADQVGRLIAELTQQQTQAVLRERYGVSWSVKSLRKVTAALAESLSPLRQEGQVGKLLELLREAFASVGRYRPMLVVGRDGVMVQTRPCWEEASAATVSVYNRRGQRLGTVYLGRMPELGQATMTAQLTNLLGAVLMAWQGPLPRLHYVTDAGSHPLDFYRHVLRPMRHPRTGERLSWTWLVDFFHAAERITKLAETVLGAGQEASAWAAKMRRVLKEKGNGVSRVLHSIGALRYRRGLVGRKKDHNRAVNYLRRFARHMNYREYRRVALPIGSGVTEAACKTIVNYRFKQSGMRWHHDTGQHVLDLRVILKSGIWHRVYQATLRSYIPCQSATPVAHDAKLVVFLGHYLCAA